MDSLKNLQPVVMSIAGSDSSAGAGIQADIKTCAALGVFCTTVLTAITAQNSRNMASIQALQSPLVESQFDALVEDFHIAAIKIGMVGSAHNLRLLVTKIADYKRKNPAVFIVVDTPLRASVGANLFPSSDLTLFWQLVRIADLVTPNVDEAALLLDQTRAVSIADMGNQAQLFIARGAQAILLKGGHLASYESTDCFVDSSRKLIFLSCPRIVAPNNHGTGCTLASAIAANILLGHNLPDAISNAKQFVYSLLERSQKPQYALGAGPLVCLHT